jgi:hypothetical protein
VLPGVDLVPVAPVLRHRAVVAREDDDGVVAKRETVEALEQPADLEVHVRDVRVVLAGTARGQVSRDRASVGERIGTTPRERGIEVGEELRAGDRPVRLRERVVEEERSLADALQPYTAWSTTICRVALRRPKGR